MLFEIDFRGFSVAALPVWLASAMRRGGSWSKRIVAEVSEP